ncbi:MAG: enoyl-CoA hydratase/isomerase family protein [Micropruina sp.]|nr:MAG: enoyl-CoA hydratase/isomerase family protein [Micropruina sp.]
MTEPSVLAEVAGGVAKLTLNRPRAINALTPEMLDLLARHLTAWSGDESVREVVLAGAGERGFCAGADVKALRAHLAAGGVSGDFFKQEYALDAFIAGYSKPVTALMHGIVMGGGLGLTAHARRRVLSSDSRLAMPETIIGLYPDVGALYELSRAPGELGTHAALTGLAFGPADGLLLGLADECAGDPGAGVLSGARGWIDECYAGDDPVAIVRRLEGHADPDARAAGALLRQRAPFAVWVTLVALRRAARMGSVADVLAQDLLIAPRMAERPDFAEGVRAQVVDKDRNPRWQHARIEDVDAAEVADVFVP